MGWMMMLGFALNIGVLSLLAIAFSPLLSATNLRPLYDVFRCLKGEAKRMSQSENNPIKKKNINREKIHTR